MPAKKSIPVGTEYTRLTVRGIGPDHVLNNGTKVSTSICDCKCGTLGIVVKNKELKNGHTGSCGCLHSDLLRARLTTHGHTVGGKASGTYSSWSKMGDRCSNPNATHYEYYGGRGIMVCEGLRRFEGFLSVLGERPPGLEVDRWPDKFGSYTCGRCAECVRRGVVLNVRWATDTQQSRNTARNWNLTVHGVTACFTELCQVFGVPYRKTYDRIRKLGWTPERAFGTPIRPT